ncbi:putative pentatricopeptide repeat-containing protein, mitochondrial-like isoform X1 [Capsicum annuum]|nr:putative pentatricopeptide repeat-containing protein, mitochondrial-like isoform X1 [Capsicum annuum]
MKQKRKKSTQSLLASLRGWQADNTNITSQDLDRQDDHVVNENIETPTLSIDNLISSSSSNEASSQVKEEPLIVQIKEELLEKTPKEVDSIVEWTAFVHHCHDEKMKEQKLGRPVCRSEVILSTLLKKDGNFVNKEGKILADKISEHLPEDQELAISYGVPLKILAHPHDAIGKVFGSEHSGRVRSLGRKVCPSKDFGMFRNSHVNLGSSRSISHQRVEDLEKQVETLKEKLTGYEETKENMATLHSFLQSKFGSELPTLNQSS